MRATTPEQFRFNVVMPAMEFWKREWLVALDDRRLLTDKVEIYAKATGVKTESNQALRDALELTSGCPAALTECQKNVEVFRGRARRRGVVILIGIPVAGALGYGAGKLLSQR